MKITVQKQDTWCKAGLEKNIGLNLLLLFIIFDWCYFFIILINKQYVWLIWGLIKCFPFVIYRSSIKCYFEMALKKFALQHKKPPITRLLLIWGRWLLRFVSLVRRHLNVKLNIDSTFSSKME